MSEKQHNEAMSKALQRRVRQLSRIEKIFYGSLILTAIVMAISIVFLQSRNLQLEQEITSLNSQISETRTDLENAKQEVSELTSRDRITKIASEDGLTNIQENVKQVVE